MKSSVYQITSNQYLFIYIAQKAEYQRKMWKKNKPKKEIAFNGFLSLLQSRCVPQQLNCEIP